MEWLTSTQVCKLLQISQTRLNSLEKAGYLKPRRRLPFNHRRLYAKEDVDRFFESITIKQS